MSQQKVFDVDTLIEIIEEREELRESHPLHYLFWESTLRCNLDCLHCGSDCIKDNSSKAREIDVSLIKRELVDVAKQYNPKEITFAIIGGEPLVRENIIEVGEFANTLGYNWGITTNGMLLSDEKIAQLKKANLKTISVSLDGLEEHHDQLRNHRGSHKIVTKGLKRLMADRFFQAFDIICCVNGLNIDHLGEFVKELIELDIPQVRFTPIFSHGRASENNHLMLTDPQVRQLLEFIAEYRKCGDSRIVVTLSEEGYYGAEFECQIRDGLHYCGSGVQIGTILHDGGVMGCPSASRKFVVGNIKESSFVDIWNKKFYQYRNGKKELFSSQCAGCEDWILCEGGGFHLLDQKNYDGTMCQYAKIKG
jgi:radical SAM protein with 4Fe4S-binding SPASM domain